MNKPRLALNKLNLCRGINRGEYRGTVEFDGKQGKIALNLEPELAEKVLTVVAEELIATAERLATQMTASLIQDTAPMTAIAGSGDFEEQTEQQASEAVASGIAKHLRANMEKTG